MDFFFSFDPFQNNSKKVDKMEIQLCATAARLSNCNFVYKEKVVAIVNGQININATE